MNLSFVEAFYWAATLRSVTRAAEKLHVTQPTVSARLRELERELGAPLLDRRDKHFRLTAAGERFVGNAAELLALWRKTKADISPAGSQRAALRIGAIESVLHSWLVPWLEQLQSEHRNLQLELTVETAPVLLDLGRRGALDLVFTTLPVAAQDVRSRPLPAMPMAFVGLRGVHERRRYRLQDLARHDLLTFQRGSHPHVTLLELLRAAGVEAPRIHAVSSISAMLRLVRSGFGIAMLPRAALEPLLADSRLELLSCDLVASPLPLHVSWRVDPSSDLISAAVESAIGFAERLEPNRLERRPRRSSKKMMKS